MQRLLGIMTLMATGLLVVALVMSAGAVAPGGMPRSTFGTSALQIDFVSFALGAVAGIGSIWTYRLPWSDLPRMVLAMIASWRRNVVLASVAAGCMCVLLFY